MGENKNGFIIAFVGQDGAGKTTISNIMLERLKKNNDVKSMYLGSGENYSSLIKKAYKRVEKKDNNLFLKDIFGMLFYVQVAKNCAKKARISKEMTKNGTIVFWDRCPQIQFEGINDGPKIESKFGNSENVLTKLIYPYFRKKEMTYLKNAVDIQPDIVIKLHLPIEESMRRKPDNDIEKIKIKHMIVENLKFPESKVIDVDATQPLEQEIIQIHTYVEDYLKYPYRNNDERQEFIRHLKSVQNVKSDRLSENRKNVLEKDNSR